MLPKNVRRQGKDSQQKQLLKMFFLPRHGTRGASKRAAPTAEAEERQPYSEGELKVVYNPWSRTGPGRRGAAGGKRWWTGLSRHGSLIEDVRVTLDFLVSRMFRLFQLHTAVCFGTQLIINKTKQSPQVPARKQAQ